MALALNTISSFITGNRLFAEVGKRGRGKGERFAILVGFWGKEKTGVA